jgi:hypothetical protein
LLTEKDSGKVGETLFIDMFFRASNHSLPSNVKFLIKTVIGGEERRGLSETRVLELPVSRVVRLVFSIPSFTNLSVDGEKSFYSLSFVTSVESVGTAVRDAAFSTLESSMLLLA